MFGQTSWAASASLPKDAVFRIAGLSFGEDQADSSPAELGRWVLLDNPTAADRSGPFLKPADLTSIKLTLNANTRSAHVPTAASSLDDCKPLFALLSRTSKLEILAIGPSTKAGRTGWTYIHGAPERPQATPETKPHTDGRAQPWQIVLHIFESRGYNALVMPGSKDRLILVSPLPGVAAGSQAAVFKEKPSNAKDPELGALVAIDRATGPATYSAEVLVQESRTWRPAPWTPAFVETGL